jgi:transcription elongation factor Elf1
VANSKKSAANLKKTLAISNVQNLRKFHNSMKKLSTNKSDPSNSMNDKECSICKRVLVNRSNLKRHLSTVHAIKDLQCKICQKRFEKQSQLSGHYRIHGKSSRTRYYTCDFCGKYEKSKTAIIKHITVHQEIRNMDLIDIFLA